MNEFDKAIEYFLNELGIALLVQYDQNNLRASGNFENRIRVQKNKLYLAEYALYITKGNKRGPGHSISNDMVFNIFKWLFDKGITPRDQKTGRFVTYEQAAWAITKGIQRDGVKFLRSQPIDFQKALLKAYKKSTEKIKTAIVNDIFKSAQWTSPNTITVQA